MCTWLERKFVFKCPYNHCPPVLILVGFSNLMLPDCLGCICFLTISVLSSSKTDNLLRSSWQPTTEAAQILFILHLNSSYLILTGVCEPKVGCNFFHDSFFPLFTFYMMGDPARVRNCILATRWAWKNSCGKSAGRCFLKPFFCIWENFFQSIRTEFLSLLYMMSLAYKISYFLSDNHNPELRCVNCTAVTILLTGVILFALVLHLNCTTLSQSESSNFFMCIIT